MTSFNEYLNEQLKNPEFKAEWDALEPEYAMITAMINARQAGITKKQLAKKTGIAISDINKLERGSSKLSLKTIQKLAKGMGMKIHLEFQPINS